MSAILRACVTCGRPGPEAYCTEHKPRPWASSRRRDRLTVSGWEEQRRAERILERYMHCCYLCGKGGADQVDHRTPLAEGGADDESNLFPVHDACHREKTAAEARRARG